MTDKDGRCCPAGGLDACGVCNGTGIITDVYGQCCSIPLTAEGLCCNQGVDDCGVCGGVNQCRYDATVTLWTNASAGIANPTDFASARCVGLAKTWGVTASQQSV